jgi:anthraniloyl-CoA monooxygenase
VKVAVVGAGPGGLYFSLLLKKNVPDAKVTIIERNPRGATYGWGVVFSDRTLTSFREADLKTYEQITDDFIIWDAIDVRYRDDVVRCVGQVFSGIARKKLLGILEERCLELGVKVDHERELTSLDELCGHDLIVGADGVRSTVREARREVFGPRMTHGRSRYIWFGTHRVFDSFTFAFRTNEHGFFQAHAYPFDGRFSTFIVECSEQAWRAAGLDRANEAESIAKCERIFERDLAGHTLRSNNSKWISFVNLKNKRWHHRNIVLIGDAAHTAHFSIGSGTKLAMEDSIALVDALVRKADISTALVDYQLERKPRVERFQEAARQSQTYFENTHRYAHMEPLQFAFHLLSRSGRMDYDDLRVRDCRFVSAVDARVGGREATTDRPVIASPAALTPFELGRETLPNRIAVRARGGAGAWGEASSNGAALVFTPPVAVSEHGRATPGDPVLYTADHGRLWAELLAGGGAAAALTLNHAGPRAATQPRRVASDRPISNEEAWTPLAASSMRYGRGSYPAAEIDLARMGQVTEDFVAAAQQAASLPFDLLELHMGHGFLLASFLSPLTNKREDGFGGVLENRLRFPLSVLDAVRDAWPKERALGVAFSADDWARGGLRLGEAIEIAHALKEHGCDVIRVVAGQTVPRYKPRYDPYFLTYLSDRIRNDVRIATIATGDISTLDHANTIVASGRADLCLLRA